MRSATASERSHSDGHLRCLFRFPIRPSSGSRRRRLRRRPKSERASSFAAARRRARRRRASRPGCKWDRWAQAGLDDQLQGMTPVEFVLRFTFSHPDMDTTIVGTVNPAHLLANLAALRDGPLPPDLYAEAKRRLAAAGLAPQAM